jgi:hypothetical protein
MTNPRDPEGLMPDADVTGGPEAGSTGGADTDASSAFEAAAERLSGAGGRSDEDPLADRTDVDEYGSDPDVRFPGDSEDPSMSTADASANAIRPEDAREP